MAHHLTVRRERAKNERSVTLHNGTELNITVTRPKGAKAKAAKVAKG